MTGKFCNLKELSKKEKKLENKIGHYYKPWFYAYVREFM